MLRRVLLALASGALLVAGFEPLAWWWVTLPSLAGLGLALHGARARLAWLPALGFGLAFYLPHIAWMRAVATPAWLGLAGLEIVFITLLGPLVALLSRHRAWPLWSAAAWATIETVRSTWPFSGMPWGRLGFGVVDTPVAPLLAYLGVTGVGFAVALTGFCLAALLRGLTAPPPGGRRVPWRPVAALAGLVAITAGANLVPHERPSTGTATVAAVQGGVPGPGNDILYDFRQVTQNHVDATVDLADRVADGELARPDFVLWPENSTAEDPFVNSETTGAQIRAAVAAVGVPLLVGAIVDDGTEHVLNQGIVWDPATGPGERYTKRHPVPYGEFIPFRAALEDAGIPVGNFGDLALIQRDMRAGSRKAPLPVAGVEVADAICFDIAYDDGLYDQLTRGAELMVVQTSNATFIDTTQVDQQFAITRARAVEAGRWLVVASTNGLSGVIAPDGEVVATAPRRATAVLLEEVGLVSGVTPGVRVGRWSSFALPGLLLLGLVLAWRRPASSRTRAGRTAGGSAPARLVPGVRR